MSKLSPHYLDISFLVPHGYQFNEKILKNLKNSLVKSHFKNGSTKENFDLACQVIDRKNQAKDDKFVDALKTISHQNIVYVHSIFQKNEFLFIFMEWTDDGHLLKYIQNNGCLEENHAKNWFIQILKGIKYLHDLKIAHCNLSCTNIMIIRNVIKVSGLSYIKDLTNQDSSLACFKSFLNPLYCAPEINSNQPHNPLKSDLYSLGVILFVMLNLIFPFSSSDIKDLVNEQEKCQFSIRASKLHELSIGCQVTIHTLLEPNPQKRWNIDKILGLEWFE